MLFNKGFKLNNESFCFVLGGGGAKGAYQIGVWQALREEKIKFNAVIGTSIGAINGAFIICNNFDEVLSLWEKLSIDMVLDIPEEFIKDGQLDINKKNLPFIKEMRKNLFKNGGLDTSPLRKFVEKLANEKKIRNSGIDFGLVTFQLDGLKPIEVFLDEIPQGKMIDYIMASAALPGFKTTIIDGKKFVDGGFYDTVPYTSARKRGYNNIIVADISGIGLNKKANTIGTNTIYIKNSFDTGSIVDFSAQSAKRNIKLGYLDAKKAFSRISGINYFYYKDERLVSELEKILYQKEVFEKYADVLEEPVEYNPALIKKQIKQILPQEMNINKDVCGMLLECAAETLKIEHIEEYKMKNLLNCIKNRFDSIKSLETKEISLKMLDNILSKIKTTQELISSVIFKNEELVKIVLTDKEARKYLKTLSSFYPYLRGALIFFEVINAKNLE